MISQAALLSAVSIFLLVYGLWRLFGPESERKKKRAIESKIPSLGGFDVVELEKKDNLSGFEAIRNFLSQYSFSRKVAGMARRAGLRLPVSVFFILCIVLGESVFFFLRSHLAVFNATALSVPVALLPLLYLKLKDRTYLKKFSEQFPNVIRTISTSIKAGHDLEVALKTVARVSPYPGSVEFQAVCGEIKLGQPVHRALQHLHERIGSNETKIFTTGVAINQELGGNLSEVLDNLERTIRDRFALEREIHALSAEGRMTAAILFMIPFGFAAFWLLTDRENFVEYATEPMGQMILAGAGIFQAVAFLLVGKIIRVKD